MTAVDIKALQRWVGGIQVREDAIAAAPVAALSATLDHEHSLARHGDTLPACWHWLFFQDTVAASGLDVDGHAKRGDFLPPVPLPRRMWAGGRLRFASPLRVGDEVRRRSTVTSISHKRGRSGDLAFVTLRHEVFRGDTLAIEEEQDLVYRGQAAAMATPAAKTPPPVAQWSRELRPDAMLLFRYSALTFNSHRIHYDREYATREEGYASLVVQGPLTVTLLLDLLQREMPGAGITEVEFRALGPLLEGFPMRLQGRRDGNETRLWALDASETLAMDMRVRLSVDEWIPPGSGSVQTRRQHNLIFYVNSRNPFYRFQL
jgi:3-methylfumaryl-CoA hydratase